MVIFIFSLEGLSYRKGVTLRQKDSLKDAMLVDYCDITSRIENGDKLVNNMYVGSLTLVCRDGNC